jgi:ribonuclease HI
MDKLEIYTDGGCRPNPGKGACAFVLVSSGEFIHGESFGFTESTINIMELTAVEYALKFILFKKYKHELIVYSDSQYLVNGMTTYAKKWKEKNWRNSSGKPVANAPIWDELIGLNDSYRKSINYIWIPAHKGNKWNEYADELCTNRILT